MPSSKKNLLLITYYFPPVKSIGSVRNYNIAQHLLPFFDSVEILTTSNRKVLPAENFPTTSFKIHEAATYDYRTAKNNKPSKEKQTHFSEGLKSNFFVKNGIKAIDSFPFNLIFGEGGFKYIRSAFNIFENEILKNQVTHIHSSYRPYADHYIAYLIKKKYPEIHWTADMRDLHVDLSVNNVFLKPFQHWCNNKILSKADVVTTVSTGLAEHLKRYNKNVFVLRNGIHVEDKKVEQKKFEKFTLAYTGSLFRDKRDPSILFEVLNDLIKNGEVQKEKIDIVYAGKDGVKWNQYLDKFSLRPCSNNLGMISRKEALSLQSSADLNLLLTYTSKELTGNITGKFYEYVSSKNPIVLLINGPRDKEFEQIMDELNAGVVAYPNQKEKLKQFILSSYQQWCTTGQINSTINLQELENYKWPKLIEKLANHISIQLCTKSLA